MNVAPSGTAVQIRAPAEAAETAVVAEVAEVSASTAAPHDGPGEERSCRLHAL